MENFYKPKLTDMKNMKFFYVVEVQLNDVGDDILEANGWKDITVYQINGDEMKKFCDIECSRTDNSEKAILQYLDDNGSGDELNAVQLIQL
jgi:hypothetical protein